MSNVDTLTAAGVIPPDHTLTPQDISAINSLSAAEVQTIITLKTKLGDDFLQRNVAGAANCFL